MYYMYACIYVNVLSGAYNLQAQIPDVTCKTNIAEVSHYIKMRPTIMATFVLCIVSPPTWSYPRA